MYGARLTGQAALDVLMEAVERLAGAQDDMAVAAILRTAARRLTGADGISIVLKRDDRVHYVDEDAVGPLWKGQNFPMDACISGWAIKNKQTVVIADIRGDPRIPLALYQKTFVKSLAVAPVGLPEPFAAIGAYWASLRRPSDEEVHALETMTRAASVAMQNVRLRRKLARLNAEAGDGA
jgi:GAF domain-containing protein